VLNVWKRVERYAREGYTSVVHGKWYHEETRATCSRATALGGHYLVVRGMGEAHAVIEYLLRGVDRGAFLARFRDASSTGFDPDVHLVKLGVANQTTMLMTESLAIAAEIGSAVRLRDGEGAAERFLSFDTICSATQERQDAILELVRLPLDLLLVVGGYNSSNTANLAAIAARTVRAYHIDDPACLLSLAEIRHKPAGAAETRASGWLPGGPLHIGLTAGASTPNNKIGETILRILALRGLSLPPAVAPRSPEQADGPGSSAVHHAPPEAAFPG
nr:4-hydroxy-3-methylbut-2-enyl diphosphate reductase [Gemmatimonadota bacterium]